MEIKLKKINNIFDFKDFLESYGFDYILNENDFIISINAALFDENEYKEFINNFINYVGIDSLDYIKF